jgi:hypothetical protein
MENLDQFSPESLSEMDMESLVGGQGGAADVTYNCLGGYCGVCGGAATVQTTDSASVC